MTQAGPAGPGASVKDAVRGLRSATDDRALLRRITGLFRPYRRDVLLVAGLILVTSGLGVVAPLLTKTVFDTALFAPGGVRLGRLGALLALMVAAPVLAALVGVWQSYLTNAVGQRVLRDLRTSLYAHLQGLSLRFFTTSRTGEIQSRLSNDVGGLQSVITDTASTILANVVTLVSTLVAMLLLSWQLTLLSLALTPAFVWLTGRVGRSRRAIAGQTQQALADMTALTEETLSVSGALLAKVFGGHERALARYVRENERLAALAIRQQLVSRAFFAVVSTFFSLTPVLVYLVAGIELSRGNHTLTAGTVVAVTTLQARLFQPIAQTLSTATEVSSSMALFQRVFDYLDLEPDVVDKPEALDLPLEAVRGALALDGVWFSYDTPAAPVTRDAPPPDAADVPAPDAAREPVWALKGLDLRIEPGQLAAIVGSSGAGKTTISYLLPRLYDPTRGIVRLDGHDLRDLSRDTLTFAVGMVTQETYLFHATIRDNIAYAKPEVTDADIEAAARSANIHDRIMSFPDGYQTVVGERGYRLSGGEKQRLAIARVLLRDPRVLVLDEATSALDTVSERLVQAALEPLLGRRTTVAIAHRLSTIRAANVIFAMADGKVVESGTHEQLLARDGVYARLYREQFGNGAVESRCADGVILTNGATVTVPVVAGTAG